MVVKRAPVAIDDDIVEFLDGLTPTVELTQDGPPPGIHAPPSVALLQGVDIVTPIDDLVQDSGRVRSRGGCRRQGRWRVLQRWGSASGYGVLVYVINADQPAPVPQLVEPACYGLRVGRLKHGLFVHAETTGREVGAAYPSNEPAGPSEQEDLGMKSLGCVNKTQFADVGQCSESHGIG